MNDIASDSYIKECTNLPKTLYHYCSYDTFKKIIEYKSFRFSSINGTNDISENLSKYVIALLKNNSVLGHIQKDIRTKVIQEIKTQNNSIDRDFFIACFSTEKDDLGQWRTAYGDNGNGICIGFNPKFFTQTSYKYDSEGLLGWAEINYNIAEQKKQLSHILNNYKKEDNEYFDDNAIDLGWDIKNTSLTMKHKAFKIENEWRMILSVIDGEIHTPDFNEPNYDNNRPYADFCLDRRADNGYIEPINSILVGANSKITLEEIEKHLSKNGFQCSDIKKSKIPYVFEIKSQIS